MEDRGPRLPRIQPGGDDGQFGREEDRDLMQISMNNGVGRNKPARGCFRHSRWQNGRHLPETVAGATLFRPTSGICATTVIAFKFNKRLRR